MLPHGQHGPLIHSADAGWRVCLHQGRGCASVWASSPLSDADVQRIVETAAHRRVRLLQQRGVLDKTEGDALAEKEPLLATLSVASIQGQLATGPRAGHRVRRLLSDPVEGLVIVRQQAA